MSDYIDTVDIEGVQYDIQDTPTKEQAEENALKIEELENLDLYSLEEILAVGKWVDSKPIYRKCFNATISTYTDTGIRRTFTHTLFNAASLPIKFGGYIRILANPTHPGTAGTLFCFGTGGLVTEAGLTIGYTMGATPSSSGETLIWAQLNKNANYGLATSIEITGFLDFVEIQ